MDKEEKGRHGEREETKWRAQVLRRTARVCNAQAKMYEKMLRDDVWTSALDVDSLRMVLKRIDNVMDWRFVNPMGEVVLDSDILAECIDGDLLRAMRECVVHVLEELEGGERG
ncbi:cAMP-binding protein [Gordonibacter sp. An230]|uniref:cAMP-binding protein n=1 Tax=Gordonibacter sp. An230 TaxID=1965592 RepID=UPI000B39DC81|nr:cAMP-binding protein [Gordonibacter sp. An230]OUO89916.1 cAMP-binding protein [Gordonibacter sp. An230]